MNQMAEAIIRSGVSTIVNQAPKPFMERAWNILKGNPNICAKRVASIMNEDISRVSSCLSDMEYRKMIISSTTPMRVRAGKGYAIRQVKFYRTNISNYEVLPGRPYKSVKRKTTVKAVTPKAVTIQTQPVTVKAIGKFDKPVVINKQDAFINSLTVAESRSLYEKLKAIFG